MKDVNLRDANVAINWTRIGIVKGMKRENKFAGEGGTCREGAEGDLCLSL